jgi:hypothetical protein
MIIVSDHRRYSVFEPSTSEIQAYGFLPKNKILNNSKLRSVYKCLGAGLHLRVLHYIVRALFPWQRLVFLLLYTWKIYFRKLCQLKDKDVIPIYLFSNPEVLS